ncbi:MAG: hypothetical protein ACTHKG_06250 [Nocardioides sp.]
MTEPVFTVEVGWTSSRPIRPDEHVSTVQVAAPDEVAATLLAAQVVASAPAWLAVGRPGCEMPTSTRVVAVAW